MKKLQKPPTPGSDEARELGCSCPVLDNSRGGGYMGVSGIYCVRQDCPLHGENTR